MACRSVLIQLLVLFPIYTLAIITLRQTEPDASIVYQQFHVTSDIVSRYAYTQVTSVIVNRASTYKELSFRVQLPETAFISNLTMTVNGTTYYGVAKEKAEALREFEQRQQAGENVGLVESRGTELFQVRISTAANSQSTFTIYYEELIVRRLSKFKQTINLNPGSFVEDFRVSVTVLDKQDVIHMAASNYVQIERMSSNEVQYSYTPSVGEQTDNSFGLARDMFIEYDVTRPPSGPGQIIVNNCYFAQFFSPSGIDPIPVDIIFIIDVSGSMSGMKITQTRQALEVILNQLRTVDRFTMVTFNSAVSHWNNRLVSAAEYRQQGITFVRSLTAGGGTNFDGGLQSGIEILKTNANPTYVQLLVMLTDGEPTVGETDPENIIRRAVLALTGTKISLNCLGFGSNLNFALLEQLALQNRGIVRQIYEDNDAALQLEGFFEEISTPILYNIAVSYQASAVETISDINFPLLFNGSELVVAGKFTPDACAGNFGTIQVNVSGTGASSRTLSFTGPVDTTANTMIQGRTPMTERLFAYLHIQQLIDQAKIAETELEANRTNKRALNLALQYNFVTELTSLIVVADDASNFTEGENGDELDTQLESAIDRGGFSGGGGVVFSSSSSFMPCAVHAVLICSILIRMFVTIN